MNRSRRPRWLKRLIHRIPLDRIPSPIVAFMVYRVLGLKPVAGGEHQGGGQGGSSGSGEGGQGGSGEGGEGGSGSGEGGSSSGSGSGEGGGSSGGQGGQGGGSGGGPDPAAAAQRLLRKAEKERDEARQRAQELEDEKKSEEQKAKDRAEAAERERDEAASKARKLERLQLVRDQAVDAKLDPKVVAALAESKVLEGDDFDGDAAKELVGELKTDFNLQEVGGGQPQGFGQPTGGGSGGQGEGGGTGSGQAPAGATGEPDKDYRGGVGHGILSIIRRGNLPGAGGGGSDDDD